MLPNSELGLELPHGAYIDLCWYPYKLVYVTHGEYVDIHGHGDYVPSAWLRLVALGLHVFSFLRSPSGTWHTWPEIQVAKEISLIVVYVCCHLPSSVWVLDSWFPSVESKRDFLWESPPLSMQYCVGKSCLFLDPFSWVSSCSWPKLCSLSYKATK